MDKKTKEKSWITIFLFACLISLIGACSSGSCDYPDDVARDGSRCGNRAASVKPGGRNPSLNKFLIGLSIVGAIIFVFAKTQSSPIKKHAQNPLDKNKFVSSPRGRREKKPVSRSQTTQHDLVEDMLARDYKKTNSPKKRQNDLQGFTLNQKTKAIPSRRNLEFVERVYASIFDKSISPHDLADLYRVVGNAEKHSYNKHDAAVYFILLQLTKMKSGHPLSLKKFNVLMSDFENLRKESSVSKEVLDRWCQEVKDKLEH